MTASDKPELSAMARRVCDYLAASGDSVSTVIDGAGDFYAFTKSGLPIPRGVVRELVTAEALKPFSPGFDPGGPAPCYVLAQAPAPAVKTACGAPSLQECFNVGFCIDCAPPAVVADKRAGKSGVYWHGDAP